MANFDDIHLKLSRKIFDPVAASSTNGVKVTSALRTDYLNRANRFIQTTLIAGVKDDNYSLLANWLSGLVKVQTPTWASGGTTVATDYVHWISAVHSGKRLLWRDPSKKLELDNAFNPNDLNCFTIMGGKIYAYYNGNQLTSGTGSLYYIFDDTGSTGNAISLDSIWHDSLVDIAASFYFSDKGDIPFEKANLQRVQMVMATLGK